MAAPSIGSHHAAKGPLRLPKEARNRRSANTNLRSDFPRRETFGAQFLKSESIDYDSRSTADSALAAGLFQSGNCPFAKTNSFLLSDDCEDREDSILEHAAAIQILLGEASVPDPGG